VALTEPRELEGIALRPCRVEFRDLRWAITVSQHRSLRQAAQALRIRRIVGATKALTARLKIRSRGESGRLIIGIHTSLSAGNLRATFLEHRQRFPNVDRQFVSGASEHLISDIASSRRCCGVQRLPIRRDFGTRGLPQLHVTTELAEALPIARAGRRRKSERSLKRHLRNTWGLSEGSGLS
jgi:DNA-binding transcriptional LysR family regulator